MTWLLLLARASAALRVLAAWLTGTKAGRITLMVAAGLLLLWLYGAREREAGRDQVRQENAAQDQRAIEEAEDAERDARRDGDLDRSLRSGAF